MGRAWLRTSKTQFVALGQLINPASVSSLALEIGADRLSESDYALACWDWIARNISYSDKTTDVEITDGALLCDSSCYTPASVLSAGKANCYGASALLVSLLRNRFPPDRVSLVLGSMAVNGRGGHSWVEVSIGGVWYLMEATTRQLPVNPWIPAEAMSAVYIADAYISDAGISCRPGAKLCISITPCLPCILEKL